MQMILNPDTKKYIPKVFAAVLIATALLLVMNVRYYQKYADFVPVGAMITDVRQQQCQQNIYRNEKRVLQIRKEKRQKSCC